MALLTQQENINDLQVTNPAVPNPDKPNVNPTGQGDGGYNPDTRITKCPECGNTWNATYSKLEPLTALVCPYCGCKFNPYGEVIQHGSSYRETDNNTNNNPPLGDDKEPTDLPDFDWKTWFQQILDNLNKLDGALNDPTYWIKLFKSLVESLHSSFLGNNDNIWQDMSHSDQRNFIMDIVNKYYNFISAMYQNYYSQQMWLMQQSYNSPLEQAQRMADAGLFNAYTSQISSGNAESPAGSAAIEGTNGYEDKGSELALERTKTKWDIIGSVFNMASSAVDAGQAFTQILATAQMLPKQKAVYMEMARQYKSNANYQNVLAAWHPIETVNDIRLRGEAIKAQIYASDVQKMVGQYSADRAYDTAENVANINGQTSRDVAKTNKDAQEMVQKYINGRFRQEMERDYWNWTTDKLNNGLSSAIDDFLKLSPTLEEEVYVNTKTGQVFTSSAQIEAKGGVPFNTVAGRVGFNEEFQYGHDSYKKVKRTTHDLNPEYVGALRAIGDAYTRVVTSGLSDSDKVKYNDAIQTFYQQIERNMPAVVNGLSAQKAEEMRNYLYDVTGIKKQNMYKSSFIWGSDSLW